MKYLHKGFTSIGSKFGEGDDWSAGELVFYSLVKKYCWRLFGASRDLCKVMAHNKKVDDDIEWYATELHDNNGVCHQTWLKDGHHIPKYEIGEVKPI